MTSAASTSPNQPDTDFRDGLLHFSAPPADFAALGQTPAIREGQNGIQEIDEAAVRQTQWTADALRYLTLQLCASKQSGHPGGFASSADAYASLVMLGHTNIVTEVGHHAPGFYSAMFLDGSLEAMGIRTVTDLQARFRERDGLLGHLSGAIPGSAGPGGSARAGSALRHGGGLSESRQALSLHHRGRRSGRALYPLGDEALPHRLSGGDQLPAGADLERLQPGASLHGVADEQRGHDGLLAGA